MRRIGEGEERRKGSGGRERGKPEQEKIPAGGRETSSTIQAQDNHQ